MTHCQPPHERPNVTRDDVARHAGVSAATVSRAYNIPDLVSPDKRERVFAAAQVLGYRPDKNASALRRSSTGAIVLLEKRGRTGVHADRIYRWFYYDMMSGIREVLDESMFQLHLYVYDSARAIAQAPPGALGDGLILHGADDRKLLSLLRQRAHPYVCCGQLELPATVNSSYTDNLEGGRQAALAFLKRGHAKPAHITGGLERVPVCQLRWQGFQEGLHGRRVNLIDGDLGVEGGFASAKKLIPDIREGRIDCIFVVNDYTAVGVIQALLGAGLRIPAQVSVIGYDNLPFIDVLPLRLATIDIAFGEVYARAAKRLLESLKSGARIHERIAPRYIPGETVR